MNDLQRQLPGMGAAMIAMARRDLLLAWKRPGDVLNPLFFFAMVATLFPLAVGPSREQLEFSGPGVLWVAALLAMLLSLNSLFVSDFEDGSLEQMLVSPVPLPALSLGKTIAHWLTSGLPLVLDFFRPWAGQAALDLIAGLSFLSHFEALSRGVLDARDILYFALVIVLWLLATVQILNLKKAR